MQTPSPSRTTKTSSSEAWQRTGQLSLPGGMSEWLSPVSTEPAVAVGVDRCRAAARMDADAVHADADGALAVVFFGVVPVRDVGMTHAASIRAHRASTQRRRRRF